MDKKVDAEVLLGLGCLAAMDIEELSAHLEEALKVKTTAVGALQRQTSAAAESLVFRAVYMRWRIMLRQCGVVTARAKARDKAAEAVACFRNFLLYPPVKKES